MSTSTIQSASPSLGYTTEQVLGQRRRQPLRRLLGRATVVGVGVATLVSVKVVVSRDGLLDLRRGLLDSYAVSFPLRLRR